MLSRQESASVPTHVRGPGLSRIVCAWCQEEMSNESTACSHCGRLRKDIQNDKNRYYLFLVLASFPMLLFFILLSQGQWATRTSILSGLPFTMIRERFNFEVFIGSPVGLLLIASFAIFLGLSVYYWRHASEKLGQWIWL